MNYLQIEKMKAKELSEIDIEEISLCGAPATKKTFIVCKGDKPKPKFESIQKAFLGWTDSEIEMLDDEIMEEMEVEKSTKENPFPSLTKKLFRHSDEYIDILNGLEACFHNND